jgi:uncharacterized damage-inducible protein DinB
MTDSLLPDAFGHHIWATDLVLGACADLSPAQLETTVPGTYGSIIDTLRHLVGGDASYLAVLTGETVAEVDEERAGIGELRAAMAAIGPAWVSLAARDFDPAEIVIRHRDDGTDSRAPRGIRLLQAIQHGTDHRSQICTALTSLGVEPPEIDLWAYASKEGRIEVVPSGPAS